MAVNYYAAAAFLVFLVGVKSLRPSKLDAIPTAGSSSWISSWWAAVKHLTNTLDVLQEGYETYKTAPFKFAELHRWTVVISNRKHVLEVGNAPDDVLSFLDAANEQLRMEYTMGPEIYKNPYHVPLVRSNLTRNIGTLFPEMRGELIMTFDDILDLSGSDWKSVPAFATMQQIVCRASNRLLVGLPLCRNQEWIDLIIYNSFGVTKAAAIIGLFPDLLKPIAARFLTSINQSNQRAREFLRPSIEERLKYLDEYEDEWVDKPNDFLSWLMDDAKGQERTVESLTSFILSVNFGAIHTISASFTHVLFYLAAYPQYIQPLREEVQGIVEKEGWSKAAVGKMRKVDSFVKECQRLEGAGAVGMIRKALKDYTFADGTCVPKGTTIIAAARAVHYDEAIYKNAHSFEPFRFSDMRENSGEGIKHNLASTGTDYLSFSLGRHSCPGRFFAANMMKTMAAHIVMTYDIKLEDETRPKPLRFGTILVPHPTAKVMFRRRTD